MKKIIIMAVLGLIFALNGNAQKVALVDATTSLTVDTITNTNTATLKVNSDACTRWQPYSGVSFEFVVKSISGTSTFTVIQEGSMDGTTFYPLNGLTAGLGTDGRITDSLSISSASTSSTQYMCTALKNGAKFVNGTIRYSLFTPFKYYRLKMVGTGTQSTQISQAFVSPIR